MILVQISGNLSIFTLLLIVLSKLNFPPVKDSSLFLFLNYLEVPRHSTSARLLLIVLTSH